MSGLCWSSSRIIDSHKAVCSENYLKSFTARAAALSKVNYGKLQHSIHRTSTSRLLMTMESSPLSALPTELIIRILDPYDMSGFSCTCQHALSLVNKKLDTPYAREIYPLESCTSYTGAFIRVGNENLERLLALNGTSSNCKFGSGSISENDSDL